MKGKRNRRSNLRKVLSGYRHGSWRRIGERVPTEFEVEEQGNNGERKRKRRQREPTPAAKPTWMIELAAKKAAARAREEEGA